MKKLFLLIGALAVIIAILFVQKSPQTAHVSSPIATSSAVLPAPDTSASLPLLASSAPTEEPVTTRATLKVAEKTYSITVTPDETVVGAMRALASTSEFAYTSREYPGLGEFVDSINGQRNADGKYWILYVNGVSATSGASTVTVNVGDVIEWKYEKSY